MNILGGTSNSSVNPNLSHSCPQGGGAHVGIDGHIRLNKVFVTAVAIITRVLATEKDDIMTCTRKHLSHIEIYGL